MKNLENKFVVYYRVSKETSDLDTQRRIIRNHLEEEWICKEFHEVVSGKNMLANKELNAAVDYCKKNNKTFAVAKHDRFGRNLADASKIAESLNWDMFIPNLATLGQKINPAYFGLMMGMAQLEREWISERTKEGLATAKAKGVKFGPKRKLSERKMREKIQSCRKTSTLKKLNDTDYLRVREFVLNRCREHEAHTGNKLSKYVRTKSGPFYESVAKELNDLGFDIPDSFYGTPKEFTADHVAKLYYYETKKVLPFRVSD